jgi:Flp pilus assembly protein TadG
MMTPLRRKQAGQSVVELAIIIPFLFVLLLGGFNTTMLIVDKLVAANSVRQGARLAAELGGLQTNPGVSQSTLDLKIVRNVLAVANGMRYAGVTEIDIYQASGPDGVYQVGNLVDQYNGSGNPLAGGAQTFTLDKRQQNPPTETFIGVRVVWMFTSPTSNAATLTFTDYAVMTAAPVLN